MEMSGNSALVIGVFGALTYDVIAAACSSPQTTEINAGARANTLMKWVYIGIGQAALFTIIGVAAEKSEGHSPIPPLIGFGLAAGLMYASYAHAKNAGLANGGPTTETYG